MMGIKQDALAIALGEDWTQQRISLLEQKETIDEPLLMRIAHVLKVPKEAIENFDDDSAINIIANNFTSNDTSTLNAVNHHCTFNPFDKIVELYESKIALYERMLKDRDGMMERLEGLVKSDHFKR